MKYIGIMNLLMMSVAIQAMEQNAWDVLDTIDSAPPSQEQIRSFLEKRESSAIEKIVEHIQLIDKNIKKVKKDLKSYDPEVFNWFKTIMKKALECAEDGAVEYTVFGEAYQTVCNCIRNNKEKIENEKSVEALLINVARQKPELILEMASMANDDE